ncbi:2-oxoacid:acceptor oxidoreductase subunit alpha [Owenweeksia hongkongensis]|uniref:2-oxoacid:acceptor oxidoreductase subunit alpha n=1 Tax=Owenweeksia hongkongensis TaxID=253245 RepID=UPI003A943C95
MSHTEVLQKVTIHFAGDSGDGIQLAGSQFTNTTALQGNDLSTFPDFPAEIRAPIGTVAGVSGFQIHFGSVEIDTPGAEPDVLVAMNVAAFSKNFKNLKKGGTLIANESGFDKRNLRLAKMDENVNPLDGINSSDYKVLRVDVTALNREAVKDLSLGNKEKDQSRNLFVLGLIYWLYHRSLEPTLNFLTDKFQKKPEILEANIRALKAGYHYGETIEAATRYTIEKAHLEPGEYRNIVGNEALGLGLITAAKKSGLDLYFAGYPITPASDILHFLSRNKNFGVKTFQAEDEIAAVTAAIGASFGGALAVTATSGPGMALKGEALGLALMLEIPMVIVNVQRGGPSTGLPTKTEQADLLQAMYGRNGEAPIPVIAANSPSDCFETAIEACRIAVERMTPVILLSDGYLANGAEPWKFPKAASIAEITPPFAKGEEYQPYARNENLTRQWAIPGMAGKEHRVGGLEKEAITGNVSYSPENHEQMVKTRAEKVAKIADTYSPLKFVQGEEKGKVLVVGWGSTMGASKVAVRWAREAGLSVSQLHLKNLFPFHHDLEKTLAKFDIIIVPELNNGQLSKVLNQEFSGQIIPLNKIQGLPFRAKEIFEEIKKFA